MSSRSRKRSREPLSPEPEATPHVPGEGKGSPSSRQEESREPSEDEEKRRVARRLRDREAGDQES
ncbi:hypothetical protein E0L93_01570 [Rubrobacter taiwanensis]|jgi:hypothetical protein|uniref:Uncharacterized protein n=1 Tax=Rubrobacter taiwanensis TaxID=185139 RepID=A0A4R1BT19_9ACTN|nr:hypothetical protein [Rubrobacter taiwanensis]TCJ20537.1 hypothetical protein E0L93_01570 [Rubrobacter taiwanensis]